MQLNTKITLEFDELKQNKYLNPLIKVKIPKNI